MKKLLAAILAVLLIASPAWAVLPTITAENTASGSDDLTFSIVVATGDTLYVGCAWDDDVKTVTVTHNGDAVTQLVAEPHSGANLTTALYRRLSPDVGTFNVVANISTADDIACYAAAIANVDQSTPETNTASNEAGGGTTHSANITCPAGNLALDVLGLSIGTVTNLAPTGGQTEEADLAASTTTYLGVSTLQGAGTTTMSWSWTSTALRAQALTCIMGTVTTRPIAPFIFQ